MRASIFSALLLCCFYLASTFAREVPLLHYDSSTRIEGEYIVVLRSSLTADDVTRHMEHLAKEFAQSQGGLEGNKFLHGAFNIGSLKGFSVRLSQDLLAKQRAHPNVSYVEVNQVVSLNQDQCVDQPSVLWNLDRISETLLDLDGHYIYHSSSGEGVTVYVIDTGIQVAHDDFQGRASWGWAFDGDESDGNGHGTHVSSTVGGVQWGVAKKVSLVAVKVLNAGGSGTTAGVIGGIDWVTNAHSSGTSTLSVANMSLGGGKSAALVSAVENSVAAGVTYAVAAGNDNRDACNYSPADAPSAITVGATTSEDDRSSFSNWGTCVDIFAPGTTITAAWIGANDALRTISGTSMASPHVAGAAAIVLGRNPTYTPKEVKDSLVNGCTSNVLRNVGTGSPNCLLYTSC